MKHLHHLITLVLFSSVFPCFGNLVRAQGLNRIYANLSHGYSHHNEVGLYVHFLDHFSAGASLSLNTVKTGPSYYTPNSTGLFGTNRRLKDTYDCKQLFLGITTHNLDRFDAHLMVGPSWINATVLSDFVLKENEYSHAQWVNHSTNYYKTVGFVVRAEALIEFNEIVGLNLSIQQNWNNIRNEFSVMVGLNLGIVRDFYNQ